MIVGSKFNLAAVNLMFYKELKKYICSIKQNKTNKN